MHKAVTKRKPALFAVLGLLLMPVGQEAAATIDGVTGTSFQFTARADQISAGDGDSVHIWGYALGAGRAQYPGPTMIVNQGDTVTITLSNELPVPVSIVFPGQMGVEASGGDPGLLTREVPAAPAGGSVSYTFVAEQPGTYLYHSGTRPDLQVEMGLFGALIVRPDVADPLGQAYAHPDTAFDREYLFLLSEIDPHIHELVEFGRIDEVDMTRRRALLWFINGRNAPDTMAEAFAPWLPTQPYNSLPRMHPGERMLMRVANAGLDLHPFHTHGNNTLALARNGRVLGSGPGSGPDLGLSEFTIKSIPGETYDAIFEWTGKGLGFDVYGTPADGAAAHDCTDGNGDGHDDTTWEWCADHGKAFPVILPNQQDLTFGGFYSGSPFLGGMGPLPPGEGGLNLNGGVIHMFHSHTELELTNNDIFPGGMMTMAIIEPHDVPIP